MDIDTFKRSWIKESPDRIEQEINKYDNLFNQCPEIKSHEVKYKEALKELLTCRAY